MKRIILFILLAVSCLAQKPYTTTSPWNTVIGTPHISPNNTAYISGLTGFFGSDPTQFTFPVQQIDSTVPNVSVTITGTFRNYTCNTCASVNSSGTFSIPVPSNAAPSTGSDAELILWRTSTGDEWGFWQMVHNSNGTWNATNGYHYNTQWSAFTVSPGPRGAGIPYLAGLIRPWEVAQGHIDHAIAFAYQNTHNTFVFPASKTDGPCSLSTCIPEGSRLQLDPAATEADFTTWGLTNTGKIIARTLQTYGMIITDTAGHPKIYAEYNGTANWGTTLTGSTVTPIPLTRFRVLDPAFPIGSSSGGSTSPPPSPPNPPTGLTATVH